MAKVHGLTELAIDDVLVGTLQSPLNPHGNGAYLDDDGDEAGPPVSSGESRLDSQPAATGTPRTRYNRRTRALEGDALKIVNQVNMSSFRRQFQAQKGKVDIATFITMMQRALHSTNVGNICSPSRAGKGPGVVGVARAKERLAVPAPHQQSPVELEGVDMIARLVELFREIDLDGDGLIVWDEFTRFIVDKAMRFTGLGVGVNEALKEYVHNLNIDPVARYRHKELLDKLVAIPRRGLLAAIEQRSPVITLYNHKTGAVVNSLTSPAPPVTMSYVEPLHLLVTANSDTGIVVWNMDEGPLRSRWQMSLAWVPSKQLLYSGATTGLIYAWDLDGQDREHRACLRGHSDIVLDLLSIDALNLVASASLDTTVCLWDAYLGTQRQRLMGHKKGVFSLAYSSCHRLLFSAGFDHEAFVWSPFTSTAVYKLKGHTASMVGVVAVEDRPQVITADATGTLKLWDLRNFRCVQTFTTEHTSGDVNDLRGMTCMAHTMLDHSQPRLVVGTKRISFFDQLRVRTEPYTDDLPITCALYNPVCLTIITAAGRNIKVWDALLGNVKNAFLEVASCDISAMCLDHRKRKIIVGDVQGSVQVYNHRTGALMKAFAKRELPACRIGISGDYGWSSMTRRGRGACSGRGGPAPGVVDLVYVEARRHVLVGYSDAAILIYDEAAMQSCPCLLEFDPMQRNLGDMACLALSRAPGATQVASASGRPGDAIKLWNHETAKCEAALAVQVPCAYAILKVLFLDPLPLLAVCCSDGVIRLWATWGIRLGKRLCLLEIANLQPNAFITVTGQSTELYPLWMHPANSPPPTSPSNLGSPRGLASPTNKKNGKDDADKPKKRTPRAGQHGRSQPPPPPMSLAWDEETQQLFSGDEKGYIRQWDLRPFLAELSQARLLYLHPGTERWATGTLSEMDAAHAQDLLQSLTARAESLAPLVLTLEAHDDAVLVLDVTHEPRALLSASSDQCARMWCLPEACLIGTLIQGLPVDIKSPAWDLPLDVASRQAKEEAEISAVLESLSDRQARKQSSANAATTLATRRQRPGAATKAMVTSSPAPSMAQTTSYVPHLLPVHTSTSSLFSTASSGSAAPSSTTSTSQTLNGSISPRNHGGGAAVASMADQRHLTILHVLDTVRTYVPSHGTTHGQASTTAITTITGSIVPAPATLHSGGGGAPALPVAVEKVGPMPEPEDKDKRARTLKRGASIIPALGAQPKLGAYSRGDDDEEGGMREDRPAPQRGLIPVLTSTIKRVAPLDMPPSPGRQEYEARQADIDVKIQRLRAKLKEIDRGAGEDIGPLRRQEGHPVGSNNSHKGGVSVPVMGASPRPAGGGGAVSFA